MGGRIYTSQKHKQQEMGKIMDNEDNQTNLTEQRQQSCAVLGLKDDLQGQKALAVELYDRFHAMKTWGKEPESLESIIRIFKKDLWRFTADEILEAISLHSQRSQEFPTVYDITNLIMRDGKPPIKESDIIAIRQKDGELRTRAEWNLLREWDEQQQTGQSSFVDTDKEIATMRENERLRKELADAKKEIARLNEILRVDSFKRDYTPPTPSKQDKIQNTIDALKADGCSDLEIQEFLASLDKAAA